VKVQVLLRAFITKKIMKKLLLALIIAAAPVAAAPSQGYFTMDAMGCMLLRECTEDVKQIRSIQDIKNTYPNSNYDTVSKEFNDIIKSFDRIGVGVFLANEKYFPVGHRGVYHTVGNNFFLNSAYMHRQSTLMSVTRHEGWHAAQDCMAGTIKNSMIAIIKNEDDVPQIWQDIATKTYSDMPGAIPWEKEAFWAGKTEGMTARALDACAAGEMWKVYPPTPLTGLWLKRNGYID
tara:strand:- start:415 stop:1116 length:702 start_codon:yes stop_codon:yes gene_type:complete